MTPLPMAAAPCVGADRPVPPTRNTSMGGDSACGSNSKQSNDRSGGRFCPLLATKPGRSRQEICRSKRRKSESHPGLFSCRKQPGNLPEPSSLCLNAGPLPYAHLLQTRSETNLRCLCRHSGKRREDAIPFVEGDRLDDPSGDRIWIGGELRFGCLPVLDLIDEQRAGIVREGTRFD